jgi:uncharacterized protein YbjT (DUF2867 family)
MKVIVFGATGMVGQGVLRECLLDPEVTEVLAVVRKAGTLARQEKLRELAHQDFLDFRAAADALTGYDACFWCLGITSAGMNESDYTRVTHDYTVAAARVLAERNPKMTFVFVSGAGTDAKSKTMWARVKGKAEDAVAALPFRAAYLFRPAFIRPARGIKSKTRSYRILYAALAPVFPLVKLVAPRHATTTEAVGRAMLRVAKEGAGKTVLENWDIDALGA